MALVVVIIILVVSFAIEQYKAGQWKKDRLKDSPNSINTYTDYFGMERDRSTGEERFVGTDISGDHVLYDKKRNIIKNLSKRNEENKFESKLPKAKESGARVIELDFLPSELEYKTKLLARKKYRDVNTRDDYIIIKGNYKRGMDLARYYYDYKQGKVICPTDGFLKDFNARPIRNTRSIRCENISWHDVTAEMIKLQEEIDANGFDTMMVCQFDM